MGNPDSFIKTYFSDPVVFADIFNFWLYNGSPVIQPNNLLEASESLIRFSAKSKKLPSPMAEMAETDTKQLKSNENIRDLVKQFICKEDGTSVYAILAIEAQRDIDYSMAARALIYDGRQYEKQLSEIRVQHEHAIREGTEEWTLRKFDKEDRLAPVITLVIYLGADEWDGPKSLHDLLFPQHPTLLQYAADYKMNLIQPFATSEEDLEHFQSDMREIMLYIKASNDLKYLERLSTEGRFRKVSLNAARVINELTHSNLQFDETKEDIEVCKAIDDLITRERSAGRSEGINIGRTEGINIGRTEGIALGEISGVAKMLYKRMQKYACTLTDAMDALDIESENRPALEKYILSL